jgi:hypothetical protein
VHCTTSERKTDLEPFDENDNRKPPESMKGMRCCLHCINCTLKTGNTLYSYGRFFCFGFKKWRRGNYLYEFMCPHFVMRDCKSCRKRYYCTDLYLERTYGVEMKQFTFCKKYENRGIADPNIYAIGRHYMPKKGTPEYDMELKFRERYGIQHDGDKGYSKKDKYVGKNERKRKMLQECKSVCEGVQHVTQPAVPANQHG